MEDYRLAYGYERSRSDFSGLGVQAGYFDGPKTNRSERQEMMKWLRRGDVVVVLAMSDLGAGKGLRNLLAEIEAKGATVEVAKPLRTEEKAAGRPARWNPDPEQDERFRGLWADVSVDGAYIIDEACKLTGENANDPKVRERVRQRLNRRYGARGKR